MLEGERAGNSGLARLVPVEWTKLSMRANLTGRLRVMKGDVEMGSFFRAHIAQRQSMHRKKQRRIARRLRHDFKSCIVQPDLAHAQGCARAVFTGMEQGSGLAV